MPEAQSITASPAAISYLTHGNRGNNNASDNGISFSDALNSASLQSTASTATPAPDTNALMSSMMTSAMSGMNTSSVTTSGADSQMMMLLLMLLLNRQQQPQASQPVTAESIIGNSGSINGASAALDWWKDGDSFFSRDTVATITDVRTGKSWKMKRTGGTNHADSEPLTAEDTAIMKSVVGSWTWDRRPVLVTVNGQTSAASMHFMPHAYTRVSGNNFPGHICIHFLNSRTHGTNKVDAAHQAAVKEASGYS